jgi:hypothetical protein
VFDHVLGDGRLRDVKAKLEEFAVDARGDIELAAMRERSGDIDLSQNHSARQQRRGPTRYDLDKF